MDKTDIFGEFGLWVWGKSIPTDVDKCQIFMRQSPLGEYIKMFQAENKKLKEQQLKLDCENNLTEDEIVEVMTKEYSRDKHFINNKNYSNATLNVIFSEKKLIAKAIIKAREEKQTRTCDPECPFCKTEEASK